MVVAGPSAAGSRPSEQPVPARDSAGPLRGGWFQAGRQVAGRLVPARWWCEVEVTLTELDVNLEEREREREEEEEGEEDREREKGSGEMRREAE